MYGKEGQFLAGGEVWRLYRQNLISSDVCGFYSEGDAGEHYIRGNMLRDFFALNKVEYIYQESSRLTERGTELSRDDLDLLDRIADLTSDPDNKFEELQDVFATQPQLGPAVFESLPIRDN